MPRLASLTSQALAGLRIVRAEIIAPNVLVDDDGNPLTVSEVTVATFSPDQIVLAAEGTVTLSGVQNQLDSSNYLYSRDAAETFTNSGITVSVVGQTVTLDLNEVTFQEGDEPTVGSYLELSPLLGDNLDGFDNLFPMTVNTYQDAVAGGAFGENIIMNVSSTGSVMNQGQWNTRDEIIGLKSGAVGIAYKAWANNGVRVPINLQSGSFQSGEEIYFRRGEGIYDQVTLEARSANRVLFANTPIGSPSAAAVDWVDGSVTFSDDSYDLAATDTWTIEGWFLAKDVNTATNLLSMWTSANRNLTVCWSNAQFNTLRIEWTHDYLTVSSIDIFGSPYTSVVQDEWNHFAIGFNNSQLTVWINGIRNLANWDIVAQKLPWTSGNDIVLGANGNGEDPLNGYIGQVRLSNIERYDPANTSFTLPSAPWTTDANTLALFTPYNNIPASQPNYILTSNKTNVDEGSTVTITLSTSDSVANGTSIPYTITGVVSGVDIGVSATGNFVKGTNNSVIIPINNDVTTEGPETMTLALDNQAASINVVINDTSLTPPPTTWDRQVTLTNPNIETSSSLDRFGYGNAMTDNYIIIGADLEDEGGSNQGVVYVYEIVDETTITLVHTLRNPNGGTNQFWGQRVDANGDYIVVGDSINDEVHVYHIPSLSGQTTVFTPNHTITESSASTGFADSVAIDNGWIVVGDPGKNGSNGSVFVYNIANFFGNPNITNAQHELVNPYTNLGTADRMGQGVDIHNDQIIVSMSGYDNQDTGFTQGRTLMYDKSNFFSYIIGSPNAFYEPPTDLAYFGGPQPGKVAINETAGLAATGHDFYDPLNGSSQQGRVYVTDLSGNLVKILESPNASANDRFGMWVTFTPSGNELIVTMEQNTQATYVYNLSTLTGGTQGGTLNSADYEKLSGNFRPNSVSANDTRFVVGSLDSFILPQVFYKFQ